MADIKDVIEKKVYAPWAFTENEREKGSINREIYKELVAKHRVYRDDSTLILRDGEHCKFDDYDIVIGRKPGYNHALYRIHKNSPGLATPELALLCDHGNLCFGYTMESRDIRVSED
jgi:hypothetical protein